MKLNKKVKDALEMILNTHTYEIKSELEEFSGEWHQEEYDGAIKKAKANNLIVDEFELDPQLKIEIKEK